MNTVVSRLGRDGLFVSPEEVVSRFSVFASVVCSAAVYTPSAAPVVKLELVRPTKAEVREHEKHHTNSCVDWGWRDLLDGEVEIHWFEGTHHALLTDASAKSMACILGRWTGHTSDPAPHIDDSRASGDAAWTAAPQRATPARTSRRERLGGGRGCALAARRRRGVLWYL